MSRSKLELEQLDQAEHLARQIMDAIEPSGERQLDFIAVTDALSTVLVSLFLFEDFGDVPRERIFTMFLQDTFCRLKDAIDAGEDQSREMH